MRDGYNAVGCGVFEIDIIDYPELYCYFGKETV